MPKKDRTYLDGWEAIKAALDANQPLRQRVLHKLRELKRKGNKASGYRGDAKKAGG